jgi:hypothetical protein
MGGRSQVVTTVGRPLPLSLLLLSACLGAGCLAAVAVRAARLVLVAVAVAGDGQMRFALTSCRDTKDHSNHLSSQLPGPFDLRSDLSSPSVCRDTPLERRSTACISRWVVVAAH